jgi:hypothetical protein
MDREALYELQGIAAEQHELAGIGEALLDLTGAVAVRQSPLVGLPLVWGETA